MRPKVPTRSTARNKFVLLDVSVENDSDNIDGMKYLYLVNTDHFK